MKLGVLISVVILITTCTASLAVQNVNIQNMKNASLSLKYNRNIEKSITSDSLFFEGFEDNLMPPPGWYTQELNTDTPWFIGNKGVHNGSYCAWINFDNTYEKDNWLISPNIDLSRYKSISLNFWGKSDTNYPGATVEVHIRGNNFDEIVWDLIKDEVWDSFDWYEVNLDLSLYTGKIVNISWRYVGLGGESFGLDDIEVIAKANQPPNKPTITGPTKIKPNQNKEYTFTTTDSDGDQVYYYIDWGDGNITNWQGPYTSGASFKTSHKWSDKATFTIKCKAKDTNGLESNFGTLDILTPRSKTINSNFLILLQNIPNLYLILYKLLIRLGQ